MLAQAGSVHTQRWCRGLGARGHDIHLISNSHTTQPVPGIKTYFLPGASTLAYFMNIPAVKKLIRDLEPNIVHAHYATGYGLWGSVQPSAPLVISVWGTDILDAKRKRFTVAPITRKALKAAHAITATSQFLVKETIAFYPEAENKITHVPFGIPVDGIADSSNDRGEGPTEFIFAKQFLKNYAPDLVLAAFAEAVKQMPPARLRMIGGGPMMGELKQLAASLKISDRIAIENFLPPEAASEAIKSADIMVMPSYNESFGVAALEAAFYGLPVIATNVGGIPEIIRHEHNGLLIQPGDQKGLTEAMIRLGNDVDLCRRMGEAGRQIAREQYDERICLDKMEAVYRKVVEG